MLIWVLYVITAAMQNSKRVFVGMSGGVDSSVTAALLKEAGYAVTGVFIKTWQPDFLTCTWREEREDAMRVAAALDIGFTTLDLTEAYKRDVVDYMLAEYQAGRTPNPDVMCNRHIKFGAFFDFALREGAAYVATGHYARTTVNETTGNTELRMGVDTAKDQSYFLWTLPQETLRRVLFPIGAMTKDAVRTYAAERGLHVADKKDSQGICFLGPVDMREFLKKFITVTPGPVLDTSGRVIGTHEGALLYTHGQRHGFTVTAQTPQDKPRYVVAKDSTANTITVSEIFREPNDFDITELQLQDVHWISDPPSTEDSYTARIRYRQTPQACTVSHDGGTWIVQFVSPQKGVAPGQSCVIYADDVCCGGGIIT